MSKENKENKKYPKSINDFQCLGPCYEKNTTIFHPTRFREISDPQQPFCPTVEHAVEDHLTGISRKTTFDTCLNPTHNKDVSTSFSLLNPKSEFSKELFLGVYYNINSFNQCMEWITNNSHVSLKTKIRIINATLNAYGNEMDLINDKLNEFFIEYLKIQGVKNIYNKIHKNIGISNNEIIIVNEKKNSLKKDNYHVERINFIVDTFINSENVKKFLLKNMYSRKDWNDHNDNLNLMTDDFIEYIQKKINLSL
jgi:hypothetical protein